MTRLYQKIWNYKNKFLFLFVTLFILSTIKLNNINVFFESERIIEELADSDFLETNSINKINDQNILLLGVALKEKVKFEEALKFKTIQTSLKESKNITRVFSFINEKQVFETGLIPLVKTKLDLSSESRYQQTLDRESRFIGDSLRNILFLIETVDLDKTATNDLITHITSLFEDENHDVYLAGRAASEAYFQKHVLLEFIVLSLISCFICLLTLYFFTKNYKIVFACFFIVIASIVISLGLSQWLFGGIELFMIISPAIIFIVAVSDIMHLINNQDLDFKTGEEVFISQMRKIGVPIAITSITTMISFFTFILVDMVPLARFGLITGLGVVITLCISVIAYAIAVEYKFNITNDNTFSQKIIDTVISYLHPKYKVYLYLISILTVLGVYAVNNIKIDNYLTDELNPKSKFFKQTKFFDEEFGGIKPLTIFIDSKDKEEIDYEEFIKSIQQKGINIDFSNESKAKSFIYKYIFKETSNDVIFSCRMQDVGSEKTEIILQELQEDYKHVNIKYGGIGYLFDSVSNQLTRNLIFGLLFAALAVGLIIFTIHGFKFKYLMAGIVPNILPIVITVGVLYLFDFYISLSNAFIFTIAFGLIIDDSIHIVSSFIHHKKTNLNNEEVLNYVRYTTGQAVIKTTIVVILCLLPLLLSQFKSVSQLSIITSVTAVFAIVFDLVYLPVILNKFK
jgi:predicted RND superfamily exporter protein